jgi:D-amino-acid dehydrogenase
VKILVLGSGVIGVTTAWYLAADGHQVGVIDRQDQAAGETSLANAGLVSPGHALSWASPRAPAMLVRSLFDRAAPLRLRLRADPAMWAWCLRFLAQCSEPRWRVNSLRKLALCRYSLEMLDRLVAETGLDYHRRRGGILYLSRDRAGLDRAMDHLAVLADAGLALEVLDAAACVKLEPALAHATASFAGAIVCREDESGDCAVFTRGLAGRCVENGVAFHYGTTIRRIVAEGKSIARVETDRGDFTADAYVMALGSYSAVLARTLGIRLPIYPLKGYSITIPAGPGAPAMSGVDEQRLLAWSRFGDRLRITSVAEFAGYDTSPDPARFALMTRFARELFPDCGDFDRGSVWAGLRPMTPEGTPIFGRRTHTNLWFNTGHGSMGWSMSCGSARIAADLVAGRAPAIDLAGMALPAG